MGAFQRRTRPTHKMNQHSHRPSPRNFQSKGLKELRVTGWANSKAAATSNDGGVGDLIAWIEKRATISNDKHAAAHNYSKRDPVRIRKYRVDGGTLRIFVIEQDFNSVSRLDGYQFAGVNVKIEQSSSRSPSPVNGHINNAPRNPNSRNPFPSSNSGAPQSRPETSEVKQKLQAILERRYNAETKILDLSALTNDPQLIEMGFFSDRKLESKFFPALMKVLEDAFDDDKSKAANITGVLLSNNSLENTRIVASLPHTLPDIINLDLSNNQLKNVDELKFWKNKFPKLDHLIVSGNPLEQNSLNYAQTIIGWYRSIRYLNGTQVRGDQAAAQINEPQMTDAVVANAAPVIPTQNPIPGTSSIEEEQARLIAEVSRQTGMNAQYARMCLESAEWNWDKAGELYQAQRASLPPEAFM